jgi:hypothetical protein
MVARRARLLDGQRGVILLSMKETIMRIAAKTLLAAAGVSVAFMSSPACVLGEEGDAELASEGQAATSAKPSTSPDVFKTLVDLSKYVPYIGTAAKILGPLFFKEQRMLTIEDIRNAVHAELSDAVHNWVESDVDAMFVTASQYTQPCAPGPAASCSSAVVASRLQNAQDIVTSTNTSISRLTGSLYPSYGEKAVIAPVLASAYTLRSNFLLERYVDERLSSIANVANRYHRDQLRILPSADLDNASSLTVACENAKQTAADLKRLRGEVEIWLRGQWRLEAGTCLGTRPGGGCILRVSCIYPPEGADRICYYDNNPGYNKIYDEFNQKVNEFAADRLRKIFGEGQIEQLMKNMELRGQCEAVFSIAEGSRCFAPGNIFVRGSVRLALQGNGNIVLYDGTKLLWQSHHVPRKNPKVCFSNYGGMTVSPFTLADIKAPGAGIVPRGTGSPPASVALTPDHKVVVRGQDGSIRRTFNQ